jgi:hypothetical protein
MCDGLYVRLRAARFRLRDFDASADKSAFARRNGGQAGGRLYEANED